MPPLYSQLYCSHFCEREKVGKLSFHLEEMQNRILSRSSRDGSGLFSKRRQINENAEMRNEGTVGSKCKNEIYYLGGWGGGMFSPEIITPSANSEASASLFVIAINIAVTVAHRVLLDFLASCH